jgi:hypothetical protein
MPLTDIGTGPHDRRPPVPKLLQWLGALLFAQPFYAQEIRLIHAVLETAGRQLLTHPRALLNRK